MKVGDIVDLIEEFAPVNLAESYDNTALIVGDREMELTSILLCVDLTEDIVKEAKEQGSNMIISHHPLIFSGLKSITGATMVERCTMELIRNNIALYSSHTSIDATHGGISHAAANLLSLQNTLVLEPMHANGEGYGVVGELLEKEKVEDFLLKLKTIFGSNMIRYTKPHVEYIQRVAFCGGSGSSLISKAIEFGADLYISADFKYHNFFEPENRIIIADIGHFESEKVVLEIFSNIISKKYPTFAAYKTKINSNPIIYL